MKGSEEPWRWKSISQRLYVMLRVDDDGNSVTDRSVEWKSDVEEGEREAKIGAASFVCYTMW